jgi:hypothetical protein
MVQTLALLEKSSPLTQSIPSELYVSQVTSLPFLFASPLSFSNYYNRGLVEGPWDLVVQFCKAHHLPLSPTHLIYLAENNEWVLFLYEAQEHGFTPEQTYTIVKERFKDPHLRDHLCVVLGDMMTPPPKPTRTRTREEEADILQIVYAAHKKPNPGRLLLLQSHYTLRPLLAIIAACYEGMISFVMECVALLWNVLLWVFGFLGLFVVVVNICNQM